MFEGTQTRALMLLSAFLEYIQITSLLYCLPKHSEAHAEIAWTSAWNMQGLYSLGMALWKLGPHSAITVLPFIYKSLSLPTQSRRFGHSEQMEEYQLQHTPCNYIFVKLTLQAYVRANSYSPPPNSSKTLLLNAPTASCGEENVSPRNLFLTFGYKKRSWHEDSTSNYWLLWFLWMFKQLVSC